MTATTTDTSGTSSTSGTPAAEPVPVGERVVATVSHGVLVLWSLLVIIPLLWTLLSSFKTSKEIFASPFGLPAHWNFDNYVSAWTTQGIGRYFVNTVIVVGSALVIVMILGAMCAYVLACFSSPSPAPATPWARVRGSVPAATAIPARAHLEQPMADPPSPEDAHSITPVLPVHLVKKGPGPG